MLIAGADFILFIHFRKLSVNEHDNPDVIFGHNELRGWQLKQLNISNYSGRHHHDATNKMILYPLPRKSIEKKYFSAGLRLGSCCTI